MGYLKKSGDIAVSGVDTAYTSAKLKTGIVGVQVRIMPSTTNMPDDITFVDQAQLQDVSTGKTETLTKEMEAEKPEKKKKSRSKESTKEPAKGGKEKVSEKKPKKKVVKKEELIEKDVGSSDANTAEKSE
jgi:ribosomal protein S3